jgi:hypothetical protein
MMDRDDFPTLTKGSTGWPALTVPWSTGKWVDIEVCEENDNPTVAVVLINHPGVTVRVVDQNGQSFTLQPDTPT